MLEHTSTYMKGNEMTTKWIDEQEGYSVGEKAFLVNFSNANRGSDAYHLRNEPAYTNRSHKPVLHGWCGTYNDTATYGVGAWKVVKIAKSGRYFIEELEGDELKDFLEEMGYPELI
jgi:hypothetical protein